MQQFHQNTSGFLNTKAAAFLKRSFLFASLYATLLYMLVRLFFYEFPITVGEGFELHSKILLVVWAFINTCKLVATFVVLLENNTNKMNFEKIQYMPVLKKSILIMFTAALTFTGEADNSDNNKSREHANNANEEAAFEQEASF